LLKEDYNYTIFIIICCSFSNRWNFLGFAYLRLFQFVNHLKKYKNARVKWTMMSPMRAAKFY